MGQELAPQQLCSPMSLTFWVLGSRCVLSYTPRTICLRMGPPTVGWAILHPLAMKKMPHRHASQTSERMEVVPQLGLTPSYNCGLC